MLCTQCERGFSTPQSLTFSPDLRCLQGWVFTEILNDLFSSPSAHTTCSLQLIHRDISDIPAVDQLGIKRTGPTPRSSAQHNCHGDIVI